MAGVAVQQEHMWSKVILKASLHQRFMTQQNSCRYSRSCVDWTVSERLKKGDGVACNFLPHSTLVQSFEV